MPGLGGVRPDDDPLGKIIDLFDDAGYIGSWRPTASRPTTATFVPAKGQCRRRADRYGGPEGTALGEGFFITQTITWSVGRLKPVADMMWRIMKFCLGPGKSAAPTVPDDLDAELMMRPTVSTDTAFFWDGINSRELRIQKRRDGTLQHPPVPALWKDQTSSAHRLCRGHRPGQRFQLVVHHAPKVPGRTCRTWWPWSNWRKEYGCSVSCAASILAMSRWECRLRNLYRFPGR